MQDKDGHLDIHEFLELVIDHSIKILHEGHHHERRPSAVGLTDVRTDSAGHGVAETEEEIEEEDEEEVPHDLKDLPWPEQQYVLLTSCVPPLHPLIHSLPPIHNSENG